MTATDRILHAAVTLFSRLGYQRTSTRDIARLADVSEVTVYRHFECKEDIFWAAIAASLKTVQPRLETLEAKFNQLDPELVIAETLTLLEDITTYNPEIPRLIAVAFFEHSRKAETMCSQHFSPFFAAIERALSKHMEDGRIKPLDRGIVISSILLGAIARPRLSTFIDGCQLSRLDNRNAVNAYLQFWVNVLKPIPALVAPTLNAPLAAGHSIGS